MQTTFFYTREELETATQEQLVGGRAVRCEGLYGHSARERGGSLRACGAQAEEASGVAGWKTRLREDNGVAGSGGVAEARRLSKAQGLYEAGDESVLQDTGKEGKAGEKRTCTSGAPCRLFNLMISSNVSCGEGGGRAVYFGGD